MKTKKSVVASVSSVSSVSSFNDYPAVPLMYARLRRLNHGIQTLSKKVIAVEMAIKEAPLNLEAMNDEVKVQKYTEVQRTFGVEMSREQAMALLGIIRTNQPVNLTGTGRSDRSNETLELKGNDKEVLFLYKRYGFLTHTLFCKVIQQEGVTVTPSVLARYANLSKQVAYLQGKASNNGYLKDIQRGDPMMMLAGLSAHPNYKSDMSTFALCKRAVKIYAALSA